MKKGQEEAEREGGREGKERREGITRERGLWESVSNGDSLTGSGLRTEAPSFSTSELYIYIYIHVDIDRFGRMLTGYEKVSIIRSAEYALQYFKIIN